MVKVRYQLSIACIYFCILLTGFGLMAFLVKSQSILRFDHIIIFFIQSSEAFLLTKIMIFFTFVGSGPVIAVLSLASLFVFYKAVQYRLELILFLAAVLGSNILFVSLKLIFQRARPDFYRLIEVGGYSFPSGHSTNALVIYGVLTFLLWHRFSSNNVRFAVFFISIFMISGIGISRVYLGVHYPTDVISGYLAGGCWLAFAIWHYQRYQEKRKVPVSANEEKLKAMLP